MIDIVTNFNVRAFEKTAMGLNPIEAQSHIRYLALSPLGWDVQVFDDDNKRESDAFDTDSTTYLIKRGGINGGDPFDVQGVVRINPTIKPYMLQEPCFTDTNANPRIKDFIQNKNSLVRLKDVWEGSRMAFHPDLNKETRREGISTLVLAKAELMRRMEINHLIGMMPTYFWNSVFSKTGWNVMPFGKQVQFLDGSEAQAARYWMTDSAYEQRRDELGIQSSLLNMRDDFSMSVGANKPVSAGRVANQNQQQAAPLTTLVLK